MDHHGDSISDDSQAERLITTALRGIKFNPKPVEPKDASLREDQSIDEPSYHFQGLAATQTQTQYEDKQNGDHSRKEDTLRSRQDSARPVAPSSPHSVQIKGSKKPLPSNDDITRRVARPVSALTTKELLHVVPRHITPHKAQRLKNDASILSMPPPPNPRTTTTKPSTRRTRRRSPSPASQDSFAGDLPFEYQTKKYIQETKAFTVPMSELEDLQSDESSQELPSSRPVMGHLNQIRRHTPPTTPAHSSLARGAMRTAATPSDSSQSGSSQGVVMPFPNQQQTQLESPELGISDEIITSGQGQVTDVGDDSFQNAQVQDGDGAVTQQYDSSQSFDYSSSVNFASDSQRSQPSQETDVATQLSGAANFASQGYENSFDVTDAATASSSRPAELLSHQTMIPATSTATSGPRSLLSSVHPDKRARYENIIPDPPEIRLQRAAQLYDALATSGGSRVPQQRMPTPPGHERPPMIRSDDAETVPDSEPTQVDSIRGSSSPTRSLLTITRKALSEHDTAHPKPERLLSRSKFPQQISSVRPEDVDAPDSAAKEAEQESADDDDDTPLAVVIAKPVSEAAGNRNTAVDQPKAGGELHAPVSAATAKAKKPAPPVRASNNAGNPGRQTRSAARAVAPLRRGRNVVAKAPPSKPPSKPKKTSGRAPVVKPRKKSVSPAADADNEVSSDLSDDDTAAGKDDNDLLPSHEDYEATELADDETMTVDAPEPTPSPGPRSRKRKRAASTKLPVKTGKASTTTPVLHPSKRLKSSPSLSRGAATRVFALWKQDSYYYPGVVYSHMQGTSRFTIHFDDETEDVVDLNKMRLGTLHVNDHVILDSGEDAVVVECDRQEDEEVVKVGLDDGSELDDVSILTIKIAGRTFMKEWKDRVLTFDQVQPVVRPAKASPSPSKMSMTSAASTRALRKPFAKTGFVITTVSDQTVKDQVSSTIKNNGGTILDDWWGIIIMEGVYDEVDQRWTLEKDDVNSRKNEFQRVFLLSDDACHTPKFLIALGLGIPCLSVDWLTQPAGKGGLQQWQRYMLPAGFCESLNVRMSQTVDWDWGNSKEHIDDIMNNPGAMKLFGNMSILCVGADMLELPKPPPQPKPNTKVKTKGSKAQIKDIPRIIMSMGPDRVEAVVEVESASQLSDFNYIIVNDLDSVELGIPSQHEDICRPFSWVKDCLFAGRLLPHPAED